MLKTVPRSLLAHLVVADLYPDKDTEAAWNDPACMTAPPEVLSILEEARLFSLAMHGAALLYNLLVGEAYEEAQFTRIREPVSFFRKSLHSWVEMIQQDQRALANWDRETFWERVRRTNPRITDVTQQFVDIWLNAICDGSAPGAADDEELKQLIASRERFQKRRQARLTNERLLRTWSGGSGTAPLTYRWFQVRRIVTDILDGIELDNVGA